MRKKILFIYPSMLIGGSTTALLSLLNSLDPEKYEIDLQLFRNRGPLLDAIPEHVHLLPEAQLHKGALGKLCKLCLFVLKGYALKYLLKKRGKRYTGALVAAFQAKELSRKNLKEYDYAVGGLEGWADWYLVYGTQAKKKYGWLHSTYANITPEPTSELPWMEQVDKLVFVTDPCTEAFANTLPQMAEKAVTVANITNSGIIRKRSLLTDQGDTAYNTFISSDAFKIVTVCRLTVSVKGLDRIVSAAKALKAEGYRFLWYIIGDGEDQEALLHLIDDAHVEDCVIPIGKRMNPYPFMAAADIMCMPSRYEGKPMVITESMILGTPPVVTEYLSAREQICHGEEGLIAENTDGAILEHLKTCMNDRSLVSKLQATLQSREYGNAHYARQIEEMLFF